MQLCILYILDPEHLKRFISVLSHIFLSQPKRSAGESCTSCSWHVFLIYQLDPPNWMLCVYLYLRIHSFCHHQTDAILRLIDFSIGRIRLFCPDSRMAKTTKCLLFSNLTFRRSVCQPTEWQWSLHHTQTKADVLALSRRK